MQLGVRALLALVRGAGEAVREEALDAACDILGALPPASLSGAAGEPWTPERAASAAALAALQRWLAAANEPRAWSCAVRLAAARASPAAALELAAAVLRADAAANALTAAQARAIAGASPSSPDAAASSPGEPLLRGAPLAHALLAGACAAATPGGAWAEGATCLSPLADLLETFCPALSALGVDADEANAPPAAAAALQLLQLLPAAAAAAAAAKAGGWHAGEARAASLAALVRSQLAHPRAAPAAAAALAAAPQLLGGDGAGAYAESAAAAALLRTPSADAPSSASNVAAALHTRALCAAALTAVPSGAARPPSSELLTALCGAAADGRLAAMLSAAASADSAPSGAAAAGEAEWCWAHGSRGARLSDGEHLIVAGRQVDWITARASRGPLATGDSHTWVLQIVELGTRENEVVAVGICCPTGYTPGDFQACKARCCLWLSNGESRTRQSLTSWEFSDAVEHVSLPEFRKGDTLRFELDGAQNTLTFIRAPRQGGHDGAAAAARREEGFGAEGPTKWLPDGSLVTRIENVDTGALGCVPMVAFKSVGGAVRVVPAASCAVPPQEAPAALLRALVARIAAALQRNTPGAADAAAAAISSLLRCALAPGTRAKPEAAKPAPDAPPDVEADAAHAAVALLRRLAAAAGGSGAEAAAAARATAAAVPEALAASRALSRESDAGAPAPRAPAALAAAAGTALAWLEISSA